MLSSPAVGVYGAPPRPGEGVIPGSAGGTLLVLGRTFDLLVPAEVEGIVAEVHVEDRTSSIERAQPLFTLTQPARRRRGSAAKSEAGARTIGREAYALRAPTTGVFYGRPDPSSPPFVSRGSSLETGQTAGLIEVMKCFSPIVHPGGAIPSPAIIEEVSVREGEVVQPGQVLFLLRSP